MKRLRPAAVAFVTAVLFASTAYAGWNEDLSESTDPTTIISLDAGIGLMAMYAFHAETTAHLPYIRPESDGISFKGEITYGPSEGSIWSLRLLAAKTWCKRRYRDDVLFEQRRPTCPGQIDVALMYGRTIRSTLGHLTAAVGPAAGHFSPGWAPGWETQGHRSGGTWGAAGSLEAFLTVHSEGEKHIALGLEAPLYVNNRSAGAAMMVVMKLGRLYLQQR